MDPTPTRQRIIDAADDLFYRQGFEHTSFADIAASVGLSRGNFYYHFKTKDDILDAVIVKRLADTRALLFFCVFHNGIRGVSPAGDIDPAYRQALEQAMAAGVEVLAWQTRVTTRGITPAGPLPFALDPH